MHMHKHLDKKYENKLVQFVCSAFYLVKEIPSCFDNVTHGISFDESEWMPHWY